MSLQSMTGYGVGEAVGQGTKVTVELSSVNRRQLDVRVSTPRGLDVLDSRLHERIHRAITRGRITGEVVVAQAPGRRSRTLRVDEDLAASYLKALRGTAGKLKLKDDFSGDLLLQLPDVVRFEEPGRDANKIWPIIDKALGRAIKQLLEAKRTEGASLQKDIQHRLGLLGKRLERIRVRAPHVAKNKRKTLMKRIRDAGVSLDGHDERLLKEVAFFAERSDITEETTRLESHLGQAAQLAGSAPPTGKSLDFLAQEMFREINTIGAKANDAVVLRHVVTFKSELERLREQVQNVE